MTDFDSFASALGDTKKGESVILDVAGLSRMFSSLDLNRVRSILRSRDLAVLLLVTGADEAANRLVETVTNGAVQRIGIISNSGGVNFPKTRSSLSGELSSYSFRRKQSPALAIIEASLTDVETVMKLDASVTFVRLQVGRASVFVWSTLRIFDVDRTLSAELEFEEAADEYIPVIIFLRFAFGQQCWHNPSPRAGIVIDDPLLTKNYGFIKFPQLLQSARRHKYHITLAFIPWNHWRSRAKDVKMFIEHSDCFSVCVHGCDHTNKEFKSANYEALLSKNFVARHRMERHRERTGLGIEPLMVCPQEQYSLEAIRAFSDSRQFLGLVCTACMPRNLAAPQLSGADLLLPAQDSFFGFPVFKRHYWNGMGAFAMSLFLGKPAILVEHHEFFRNGSVGTEEFVRRLAELRPGLQWTSLVQTVTSTHARRRVCEGRWEVRFFTDIFHLEHGLEEPTHYRLLRRIPKATVVKRVLVGGKEVPFSRENGFLTFETHTHHPQTLFVQVEVAPIKPTKVYSSGVKYQASVALRRGLSELRDNIIARNRFALRAGRLVIKSLKQT